MLLGYLVQKTIYYQFQVNLNHNPNKLLISNLSLVVKNGIKQIICRLSIKEALVKIK